MIRFACAKCAGEMSVEDNMAGVSASCPSCGNVAIVPDAAGTAQTLAVPGGAPYAPPSQSSGKAVASLVLGLIGMLAWLFPLLGLPVNIVGLVLGIQSLRTSRRSLAIAGLVLCIIGLTLTVINSAIGAYLGATGQLHHPR